MKLNSEPFEKIKSGLKDIEVRLYDEKRRGVNLGDRIVFSKLPENEESISVIVTGLSVFRTFEDLFSHFENKRFGHVGLSVEEQVQRVRMIYFFLGFNTPQFTA